MSVGRSLAVNTLARAFTEITNRLGSALFWILVTRFLGVSRLGSLAFGLSLLAIFTTLSTLGLGSVIVRDVARHRELGPTYFGNILILGTAVSILSAGLMCGFVMILTPNADTLSVALILAGAVLPSSLFYWCKSILSAAEKMPSIALARVGENVFKVVVGVTLLLLGANIVMMAIVILAGRVVSAILIFFLARRITTPLFRIDVVLWRYWRRLVPSFSAIALFNSLFWALPVIMLTRLSGEFQAGLFSAAFKIVDLAISFTRSYAQAWFPVVARMSKQNNPQWKTVFVRSVKYLVIFGLAIAAGTTVLADKMILLAYGDRMPGVIEVLRLLIWMAVPFAMVPVFAYILVSHHRQDRDLLANMSAAMTVFIAGLFLVPIWGAQGMAFTVIVASFIFWTIELFSIKRFIYTFSVTKESWRPLGSALIMGCFLLVFKNTPLVFSIGSATVIYGFLLLITKSITAQELQSIRNLKSA